MEGGRVAISYKPMFLVIMLVMGTMVQPSNASYQQCFVRCLRTCIFDIACTFRCGSNCFLTDPPFTGTRIVGSKRSNNNNLKFCNLGCVAATLATHNPSAFAIMNEGEAEKRAKKIVNGCSSSCSKNFELH